VQLSRFILARVKFIIPESFIQLIQVRFRANPKRSREHTIAQSVDRPPTRR